MDVVIIDEERYFAESVQAILEIHGHNVRLIADASSALEWFSNNNPAKEIRILVDVALAPGKNEEIFSEETTDRFLITGIVLCRTLFEKNSLWKARAESFVLYTAHYTTNLWGKINAFADENHIRTWQKRPQVTGTEIVDLIKNSAVQP